VFIKLIKSDSQDCQINAFELSIYEKKKKILKKILSTVMFLEHQIRMISEGPCDTEHWSNVAENSALPSQE